MVKDKAMMIIPPDSNQDYASHPGSFWMAIFSLALIFLMLTAVGIFFLRLRHRSKNPLQAPTCLEDVLEESGRKSGEKPSWERSSDWWKDEP